MTPKLALDTNAYRALDDGNPKLGTILKSVPQIGMPIIVLGELYFGIFQGSKQSDNMANLTKFLATPRVELLDIDETTAKLFGEIATELRRVGRPIQQDDMWIAALCKQHGYALATADKDFESITGLELINF
ncbi:MAG TPA: type II toxin-antitoxin system VapC family toxin [Candidatus Saccharimonadales bacterium]